jgi:hypothetical protein
MMQVIHILRHLASFPYAALLISPSIEKLNILERDNSQLKIDFPSAYFSMAIDKIFEMIEEIGNFYPLPSSCTDMIRVVITHPDHFTNILIFNDDAYIIDHVPSVGRYENPRFADGCVALRLSDRESIDKLLEEYKNGITSDNTMLKELIGVCEDLRDEDYNQFAIVGVAAYYVNSTSFSRYLSLITDGLASTRELVMKEISKNRDQAESLLDNVDDNYNVMMTQRPNIRITKLYF